MVPHIQSLEHRAARQRTLHVEVPPLRIRIVLHRRQEADRLPKERVRAQRGSNRLRKSRREWIAETIRRGQVVVRRRHICRRRAESLLVRYCTRAICSRGGQRRERRWLKNPLFVAYTSPFVDSAGNVSPPAVLMLDTV